MSTRAMRKLRGDTLDDDLKKINESRADNDKDEDDDEDDSPATGGRGGGGGARPKQRINPFEMVSICEQFQDAKNVYVQAIGFIRFNGQRKIGLLNLAMVLLSSRNHIQ